MMCYDSNMEKNFPDELTDDQLAVLAKNDPRAAAELLARALPIIRSLAHSIDPAISEDLMQEGLLGALSAIESFDCERGRARTYLVHCAKNKMLSAVNRNKLIGGGEELEELADVSEEFSRERIDELYRAVENCLTALEREVVLLYLKGLSYREIAVRLDITAKSVDNAMQRSRRRLREEFDKK